MKNGLPHGQVEWVHSVIERSPVREEPMTTEMTYSFLSPISCSSQHAFVENISSSSHASSLVWYLVNRMRLRWLVYVSSRSWSGVFVQIDHVLDREVNQYDLICGIKAAAGIVPILIAFQTIDRAADFSSSLPTWQTIIHFMKTRLSCNVFFSSVLSTARDSFFSLLFSFQKKSSRWREEEVECVYSMTFSFVASIFLPTVVRK